MRDGSGMYSATLSPPPRGGVHGLQAMLDHEPTRRYLRNFQVRNIALDFDLTRAHHDTSGRRIPARNALLLAYIGHGDEIDESLLARAKTRLAGFEFVGIAERFEESVQLLCATFGWSPPRRLPRLNTSRPDALTVQQLPPKIRDEIEELTRLDAELFRFGEQSFEQQTLTYAAHKNGPVTPA